MCLRSGTTWYMLMSIEDVFLNVDDAWSLFSVLVWLCDGALDLHVSVCVCVCVCCVLLLSVSICFSVYVCCCRVCIDA
jgi:hypothetical protein